MISALACFAEQFIELAVSFKKDAWLSSFFYFLIWAYAPVEKNMYYHVPHSSIVRSPRDSHKLVQFSWVEES